MVPLRIEGNTLGQKHRNYNKIVNDTEQADIVEINYDESDLENLLKIDRACKSRNVEYVFKVFESEDILYVSRAIKKSTWLITDPHYSHIINLKYLYEQIYPNMTRKAFNKLLLHVRLNLKDEQRAEEFFNYYKERDFRVARKWLPLCSVKFTENIIQKYAGEIPKQLLKRLCEKSASFLEVYNKSYTSNYRRAALMSTMFLLKSDTEKYLDIIEKCDSRDIPSFGPKKTKFLMTKCPERIMGKLEKYSKYLHLPTFARFIKQKDMKEFILKNIKNKEMHCWFSQNSIDPFIQRLPKDDRFEFVKELFIDKKHEGINVNMLMDCGNGSIEASSQNIYYWYKYASFNTSFTDLKKVIRTESDPAERTAMFMIILNSAGIDINNIYTLLKYYRENHINEPFKFKIQFVNAILSRATTHIFDKETREYLNDLFSSMEVYNRTDKPDQNCIKSIILYNIVHGEEVPDIIQQKFLFDTFQTYQKKLSEDEKEKVFLYLYNYLLVKISDVKDEYECSENLDRLINLLSLLRDWNKELNDFPVILNKIKLIVQQVKINKWDIDLARLFDVKKSWRKLLFAESILISPTQETFITALKHSPELLEEYRNEVNIICLNNDISTNRFLKKIRVFWSQTLANTYKEKFISKFDQKKFHKSIIMGLCIILPRNEVMNLIENHVPSDFKIDWSSPNEVELSLRKHIAMNLHLARPQPSPAAALLYAKGDYLQYVLPSLNAILYNISCRKTRDHLPKFLNAPVSLQKHGIRLAFAKLKHDELNEIFSQIWEFNKNSSIRADIFIQTINYLCDAKDDIVVKEIWKLLKLFMDNLTCDENKLIYTKLSHAEKVPMAVRPEFWMKSYKLLRSMPAHVNCGDLLRDLRYSMSEVMEFLEDDFVAEVFLESFDDNFSTDLYAHHELVAAFLLSTKTEEAHIARYNKILIPILEKSFNIWDTCHNGANYVKFNLLEIFTFMDMKFESIVLNKNMFLPIPMYEEALTRFKENLPIQENYVDISTRKLSLDCVKIFDKLLKSNEKLRGLRESTEHESPDWSQLYTESAVELGGICCQYLKDNLEDYFLSIYMLLGEAFDDIFSNYGFSLLNRMQALKTFLAYEHLNEFHLFVLNLLPEYDYNQDEVNNLKLELLTRISMHSAEEVHMVYSFKQKMIDRKKITQH